jgi:hypothetical protein
MRFLKLHVIHLLFTNKTSRKFSCGTFFDKANVKLWMLLCKVMYFPSIISVDNVSRYVDKEINEAFQPRQITKGWNCVYPCWTARAKAKHSCCVLWSHEFKSRPGDRLPWDLFVVFLSFYTKIPKQYLDLSGGRFLSHPFRFSMNSSWRLNSSKILHHVAW